MGKPKVPNTISDKKYAELQQRAQKAAPSMFSREAVAKRKASSQQREKRNAS